jgi:hypothetical protein
MRASRAFAAFAAYGPVARHAALQEMSATERRRFRDYTASA